MYQRSISNTCCNKLILIIFFDNFPKFVDGIMTLGWPDWHSSENTSCLQSPINVYFNTTAAFYSRFHGCIPGQPVNVRLFTVQECISPFIDLSKGSQLNEVMTHVLTIHGWDTTSLNTYSGSVMYVLYMITLHKIMLHSMTHVSIVYTVTDDNKILIKCGY